jgi:hypothetical protein
MGTPAAPVTQASFDAAYLAAQPAAVKKLMQTQSQMARVAMVPELVSQGYVIDFSIMAWANSAYVQTQSRLAYGYTWVPSAGMPPIQESPNVSYDGKTYDPAIVPAGAILVTLNEALLPSIFTPVPGTPAAAAVKGAA